MHCSQILAALGVSHINFFSLDVEGAELQVLETVDFTKVHACSLDLCLPVALNIMQRASIAAPGVDLRAANTWSSIFCR